eukprot:7215271-Pyramimonas_sp.AAC.1
MHTMASSQWSVFDSNQPSDHCPVRVALSPQERAGRPTIPSWVSRPPLFNEVLEQLIREQDLSDNVF